MKNPEIFKEFDYRTDDIHSFLNEEFERIIQQDSFTDSNNVMSDSRALAVWFLHQETGLDYENALQYVLDDKNDAGIDLIWIDNSNNEILIGQVEYEGGTWGRSKVSKNKAINTFNEFMSYLDKLHLPENLPDHSKMLWRQANKFIKEKFFRPRYIYITPKVVSEKDEKLIRTKSGISNYEFFDYEILMERAHEFIDGQTGLSNFYFFLNKNKKPLVISLENGLVTILDVTISDVYRIVKQHRNEKRLKSLFASNVRSYLNKAGLSKEIGGEIRRTIEDEPSNFMMYNNGITIQAQKVEHKDNKLLLKRASISNGCQTSMNILKYFDENPKRNPPANILITIIQLNEYSSKITGEIARFRNFQNEVNYRDLRSNDPLLVTLQHRIFANNLEGSTKRYYLQRKRGEKESLLQEEPVVKRKYLWIDVERLAKCIAAVIRQKPEYSGEGSNQLFGKYYKEIFPGINEPSYKNCIYAFWLDSMINHSYKPKDKWKVIGKDQNIYYQKDFKRPAKWCAAAFLHKILCNNYSIDKNNNFQELFTKKCEIWKYGKKNGEVQEFQKNLFDVIEKCFIYMHAIAKDSLNKNFPKKTVYTNYDDLFKGPNYDIFIKTLSSNKFVGKKRQLLKSIDKLMRFLNYA